MRRSSFAPGRTWPTAARRTRPATMRSPRRCTRGVSDAFTELGDRLRRIGRSSCGSESARSTAEMPTAPWNWPSRPSSWAGEIGYRVVEAQALATIGEIRFGQGEHELGLELLEQGADLAGEIDFPWWRSRTLRKLADCMLDLGRVRGRRGVLPRVAAAHAPDR